VNKAAIYLIGSEIVTIFIS